MEPDPRGPHPDGTGPDDTGPGDADEPSVLDVLALRRRVLLSGVITMVLFLTAAYVLTALEASTLWLLPVLVVIWVAVVRPLMAPVRAATRLRRDLAFQAFQESRGRGEHRG